MRQYKGVCVFALTLVLAGAVVASAAADPTGSKRSAPITIACDNNTTYYTVANGGIWAPAHDLNSNSVLIPIAFGAQTDVFTPFGGSPRITVEPPHVKGSSGPNGAPLLHCNYLVGPLTFPDGSTFQASGTVTGFATPEPVKSDETLGRRI